MLSSTKFCARHLRDLMRRSPLPRIIKFHLHNPDRLRDTSRTRTWTSTRIDVRLKRSVQTQITHDHDYPDQVQRALREHFSPPAIGLPSSRQRARPRGGRLRRASGLTTAERRCAPQSLNWSCSHASTRPCTLVPGDKAKATADKQGKRFSTRKRISEQVASRPTLDVRRLQDKDAHIRWTTVFEQTTTSEQSTHRHAHAQWAHQRN
jgi:hypothetical protein